METVPCSMPMVIFIEERGFMGPRKARAFRFTKTKEFSTMANGRTISLTEKASCSIPTIPNTKASSRTVSRTGLASSTKQAKRRSTNKSTTTGS